MNRSLCLVLLVSVAAACAGAKPAEPALTEVDHGRAGDVEVALYAPTNALKPTRNYCTLEFRTAADRHLVDVGTVKVHTTMTMEGAPMDGFVTEPKRLETGRYAVEMVMAMKGDWHLSIEWMGPAGTGSVAFASTVQ